MGIAFLGAGRTFTEEEIENGAKVAMISSKLAHLNSISIGDTIILESIIQDTVQMHQEGIRDFVREKENAAFYAHHEVLEFTVIGIVEPQVGQDYEFMNGLEVWEFSSKVREFDQLQNMIHIPLSVGQQILQAEVETLQALHPKRQSENQRLQGLLHEEWAEYHWEATQHTPVFIVHHPRYLDDFAQAATYLLPAFWGVTDFR